MKLPTFTAILSILVHVVKTVDFVAVSKDVMVPLGRSELIFCETDEDYELCKWTHQESGKVCRVASDNIGMALSCKDDEHITWELTSTRCGIVIESATRADAGNYTCTLATMEDDIKFVEGQVEVDVSAPAIVSFEGSNEERSSIEADADQEQWITCFAKSGYPKPELVATIGQDRRMVMDPGHDKELEAILSMDELTQEQDGSFSLKRTFRMTPYHEDCGKYVKCRTIQKNKYGTEIYPDRDAVSRKLMVVFPPEPFIEPQPPFPFTEGDNEVVISFIIYANPVPTNNEAIWYINPSGTPNHDSTVLQADQSYQNKYFASPLNVSGHSVTASMVVKNPTELDTNHLNYLEVSTRKGVQRYNFTLEMVLKQRTPETIKTEDVKEYDDEKVVGARIGIIVAIVALVSLTLVVVGVIVYVKKTGRCCFRYNAVPVRPDIEIHKSSMEQSTSIIKNGKRGGLQSGDPEK